MNMKCYFVSQKGYCSTDHQNVLQLTTVKCAAVVNEA